MGRIGLGSSENDMIIHQTHTQTKKIYLNTYTNTITIPKYIPRHVVIKRAEDIDPYEQDRHR